MITSLHSIFASLLVLSVCVLSLSKTILASPKAPNEHVTFQVPFQHCLTLLDYDVEYLQDLSPTDAKDLLLSLRQDPCAGQARSFSSRVIRDETPIRAHIQGADQPVSFKENKIDENSTRVTEDDRLSMNRRRNSPYFTILSDFFFWFAGNEWYVRDGWGDEATPLCYWYGVTCASECSFDDVSNNLCPVVAISLVQNNLMGQLYNINLTLSALNSLEELDLSQNLISGFMEDITLVNLKTLRLRNMFVVGVLPDFQGMPLLETLDLGGTQIDGPLPNFSSLPLLQNLVLDETSKLTGELPSFINTPLLVSISITSSKLKGTLPREWYLPFLATLVLQNNQLSGTIPDITGLPSLVDFFCEGNQLEGTLPNFSSLTSLAFLSLSDNLLTGDVTELTELPLLGQLLMTNNLLNGTIPNFKTLNQLRALDLTSNQIVGTLPSFEALTSLESLSVLSNNIGGTIPPFASLANLAFISLGRNKFEGSLPDFSTLQMLSSLSCSENQLTGQIPDFQGLFSLYSVDLSLNKLSGTLHNFPDLPFLNELKLFSNRLSGTVPNFSGFQEIVTLDFYDNQLNGTLADFSNMPNLQTLDISANHMTGTIPNFQYLANLQKLLLWDNQLTGTVPFFNRIRRAQEIDISRNQLSGPLPTFFMMNALKVIAASNNNITGTLPILSSCPELETIDLFSNKLHGTIPKWIFNNLVKLDLGQNFLSGTISPEIYMYQISFMDLSRNSLSGTVPSIFGQWENLQTLILSDNQFVGTLPVDFWSLPRLMRVDLSNNEFSGDVREFLVPSLDKEYKYQLVNLDNNLLTGTIDAWIFENVPQITQLSLRYNRISGVGDLDLILKWKRLDLSSNPLVGTIPESHSRFARLDYMGLLGSNMKYTDVILPKHLVPGNPFQLKDRRELYMCPTIQTNDTNVATIVDVEPQYYDHLFCECLPNYFGFRNRCLPCPEGCDCPDGVTIRNCYASPSIMDIRVLVPCPVASACGQSLAQKDVYLLSRASSSVSNVGKDKTTEGLDAPQCDEGYTDRVCSKCEDGYGHEERKCSLCDPDSVYTGLVLGPIGFALFVFYLYKKVVNDSAKLKVILFHIQTLSIVSAVFSDSSQVSKSSDASFSLGSMTLPSLPCMLGTSDPIGPLIFSFSRIPVLIVIGLILHRATDGVHRNKAVFIVITLLNTIYYSIARQVFGVFGCTLYDDGQDAWYLNVYPWITCNLLNDEYQDMLVLCLVVFVLYMILFPAFLYRIVFDPHKTQKEKIMNRFGFLYRPYKEGKRYWEVVILVRRILFALVISVVPYTSPAILYLSLVVVIQVSIWLQQKHTPFKFETENRMELGSLYVIFTSFFLAMVHSFIPDQEWISPTIIVLNVVTVAIFLLLATVPALSQYVETLASDNPRNYQAEMTPIDLTSREMKDNDGEVDAESRPVAMDLQLE